MFYYSTFPDKQKNTSLDFDLAFSAIEAKKKFHSDMLCQQNTYIIYACSVRNGTSCHHCDYNKNMLCVMKSKGQYAISMKSLWDFDTQKQFIFS